MRWYRGAYLELIFCVFRSFLWLLEQGLDHTRHPPLVSLPHFDTTRTQDASCDVFANRPPRFALHRLNICSAPPTLAPADYRNKATRNLQNLKPNSRLCSCRSYAFRVRCSVSGDWALGLSAFDSSCSSSWVPGRFDKRYFCPRQWLAGTVTLALANIPCTALRPKRKRGPGITLLSIGPAATGKGHKSSGKRPQPPPRRHSQAAPESAELERRCHGPSPSPSAARLPGQRMPRPGGFTRGPSAGRIAAVTPTRHGSSTVCVLHGLGPGCGTGCNGSRTVILTQITRRLKIECQEDENLKCWLCGRRWRSRFLRRRVPGRCGAAPRRRLGEISDGHHDCGTWLTVIMSDSGSSSDTEQTFRIASVDATAQRLRGRAQTEFKLTWTGAGVKMRPLLAAAPGPGPPPRGGQTLNVTFRFKFGPCDRHGDHQAAAWARRSVTAGAGDTALPQWTWTPAARGPRPLTFLSKDPRRPGAPVDPTPGLGSLEPARACRRDQAVSVTARAHSTSVRRPQRSRYHNSRL